MGIEKAIGKVSPVAYVEIEAYAAANLVAKMEADKLVPVPVFTDLKTFRPHIFRNKVDILTAGYPCQPFSNAGRRRGRKDPRHLWPWIRDAIAAIRPGICFFENVEGHITLGLREVLTDLASIGYRVESSSGEPTWGLFSAAECGAPHQRKRVFIMAYAGGNGRREDLKGWFQKRGITFDRNGKALEHPGLQRQEIPEQQAAGIEQSGPELGNTSGHDKRRSSITTMHREGVAAGRSGGHVADARGSELNRVSEPAGRVQNKAAWDSGFDLAYTDVRREQQRNHSRVGRLPESFPGWPARPGEPQHWWEEPRVLADSCHESVKRGEDRPVCGPGCQIETGQSSVLADNQRRVSERGAGPGTGGWKREPEQTEKTLSRGQGHDGPQKTEPGMGRAVNGPSNRVDRLRLLGNGVVPATAEKAFTVLIKRILNPAADRKPIEIQLDLFKAS